MARILLVEDNEMNRDMLSRRLIRKGHEVPMAVDGQHLQPPAVAQGGGQAARHGGPAGVRENLADLRA